MNRHEAQACSGDSVERRTLKLEARGLNVAAGVSPAVEGGVSPPGRGIQFGSLIPPGKMPGFTAGETLAAAT